ncbi:hypothetical protein F66182_1567 [Fusarium sp. NRRL 66182]|nr:hypothetical protein F66182_1567 [Fusarium sp. NRRL 66182]
MRRRRDKDPVQLPNHYPVEFWTLLAPLKEQRMMLPSREKAYGEQLKPQFFCACYLSFDAFKLLCNSIDDVEIKTDETPSRELTKIMPPQGQAHARLERLPTEVLGTIFMFLDAQDFISLGLCSQCLWAKATLWTRAAYLRWRKAWSWAGSPMICLGSKVRFTPPCLHSLFPSTIPLQSFETPSSTEDTQRHWSIPTSIWYQDTTARYEKRPDPYDDLYREGFWNTIRSSKIPQEFHGFMAASLPTFSIRCGSKWYLRNLTQKEFIRMEAVITTDGEATVSFLGNEWLTLDILLVWLISWKGKAKNEPLSWEQLQEFEGLTDQSLGDIVIDPSYGPLSGIFWPIWVGTWAGHSLDVVTEEMGEGWIDRTSIIASLSVEWMSVLYGLAMAEVGGEEKMRWAEIFERTGRVPDLQLRDLDFDSQILSPSIPEESFEAQSPPVREASYEISTPIGDPVYGISTPIRGRDYERSSPIYEPSSEAR